MAAATRSGGCWRNDLSENENAGVESTPAFFVIVYSPMILTSTRLRRRPSNSP